MMEKVWGKIQNLAHLHFKVFHSGKSGQLPVQLLHVDLKLETSFHHLCDFTVSFKLT